MHEGERKRKVPFDQALVATVSWALREGEINEDVVGGVSEMVVAASAAYLEVGLVKRAFVVGMVGAVVAVAYDEEIVDKLDQTQEGMDVDPVGGEEPQLA